MSEQPITSRQQSVSGISSQPRLGGYGGVTPIESSQQQQFQQPQMEESNQADIGSEEFSEPQQ
jgi:hypothetical protein